jgi:hypothetical protein
MAMKRFSYDELRAISRGLKNISVLAYNPQSADDARAALKKVEQEMSERVEQGGRNVKASRKTT